MPMRKALRMHTLSHRVPVPATVGLMVTGRKTAIAVCGFQDTGPGSRTTVISLSRAINTPVILIGIETVVLIVTETVTTTAIAADSSRTIAMETPTKAD